MSTTISFLQVSKTKTSGNFYAMFRVITETGNEFLGNSVDAYNGIIQVSEDSPLNDREKGEVMPDTLKLKCITTNGSYKTVIFEDGTVSDIRYLELA